MGNVIGSLLSGFAQAVEKLFGSPLEFLTGKSCRLCAEPVSSFNPVSSVHAAVSPGRSLKLSRRLLDEAPMIDASRHRLRLKFSRHVTFFTAVRKRPNTDQLSEPI
ncbi:hypothetical protein RJ639_023648 [Escallonia herrerae]|uniref:Uncharacterized protein n=1 Tax=Escallonia herrerae TaxID=1293975 RepID=A0AA88V1Z7_9ASTE|nr:hypothetical protein RJ639_023648 [Escallonia herrerae]